jgi:hypothetical protein
MSDNLWLDVLCPAGIVHHPTTLTIVTPYTSQVQPKKEQDYKLIHTIFQY